MNDSSKPLEFALPNASILADISIERAAQRKLYTEQYDDRHRPSDWVALLVRHLGYAAEKRIPAPTFRQQMVRIAAIAIAAIEYTDRNSTRVSVSTSRPCPGVRYYWVIQTVCWCR